MAEPRQCDAWAAPAIDKTSVLSPLLCPHSVLLVNISNELRPHTLQQAVGLLGLRPLQRLRANCDMTAVLCLLHLPRAIMSDWLRPQHFTQDKSLYVRLQPQKHIRGT